MSKHPDPFGPPAEAAGAGLGARAASGGITAVSFQGARMGLQLVTLAVFARLLAPEDFGVVVMATTVTAFVGMFSNLGLNAATIQRRTITRDLVSALWLTNCALGIVVMVACFALAPFAAAAYDTPEVAAVVFVSALAYPITAASAQHSALLARTMRWMPLQSIPVIAAAVGQVTGMALAWQTDIGYWALVVANVLTPIVQCALFWWISPWRPNRVTDWTGVRESISFGLYLTGFNFLTYFHRTLDNVLIGAWHGTVSLGHYSRAYSIFMLPLTLVSGPASTAMIPAMSRAVDDHRVWSSLYLGAVAVLTAISAPVAIVLTFHAEGVVGILFGPGWDIAAGILAALGPAMLVHPLFASAQWLFVSRGQSKKMFWASIPAIGAFVIAYALGIDEGAEAVARYYTIASLVVVPIWLVYAAVDSRLPLGKLLVAIGAPSVMAALAFGAIEWALADMVWIVRVAVFALVYGVAAGSIVLANPAWRERMRSLVDRKVGPVQD